jgi:hypothetical protein
MPTSEFPATVNEPGGTMADFIALPEDPDEHRAEFNELLRKFKRDELTPAEEARFEEYEDENDLRAIAEDERIERGNDISWEQVRRRLVMEGRLQPEGQPRRRRVA